MATCLGGQNYREYSKSNIVDKFRRKWPSARTVEPCGDIEGIHANSNIALLRALIRRSVEIIRTTAVLCYYCNTVIQYTYELLAFFWVSWAPKQPV